MVLPGNIRLRGRAADRNRSSGSGGGSRRRSVTRSPGASERVQVVGLSKWASFVDAIASPPPSNQHDDQETQRLKHNHDGLYDRMRRTQSWRVVAVLCLLSLGLTIAAQYLSRRSPICFGPSPVPVCTFILACIFGLRALAVLALVRAAYVSFCIWRLSVEIASLDHLTNHQRRLLGLPPVASAPTTPAWQTPSKAALPPSTLGLDWSSSLPPSLATPRTPLGVPGMPSPATPAVDMSPYVSPTVASPATATQVLRTQHLGLSGSPAQYAVGDVLALEELSRLRSRHADGEHAHAGVTGVLMGNNSGGKHLGGFSTGGAFRVGGSNTKARVHSYQTGYRRDSGRGLGTDIVSFDNLESVLGVRSDQLDSWTNNLRGVVARHIQDYFMPLWNSNMQELSHVVPFVTEEFLLREQSTVSVPLQGTLTLQEMMLRFRDDPMYNSRMRGDPRTGKPVRLWEERQHLERFLDVRGEDRRMYVLDRLATLASDDQLWQYAWDSGGVWDGQAWTAESGLPTDAHIVDHYTCTLLDTLVRDRSARAATATRGADRLFSSQHRVAGPRPPAWCRAQDTTVVLSSSNQPLHLRVLHSGTQYDLPSGRLNLFYAFALFLHLVKRHHSNQIAGADMAQVIKAVVGTSNRRY